MIFTATDMTDKEQDRALQAAMKRRASQVPPLTDDFADHVMERMGVKSEKTLSPLPLYGESLANARNQRRVTPLHKGRGRGWVSIAAVFLAAAFLCGITYAAYRVLSSQQKAEQPSELSIINCQLSIHNEKDSLVRFADIRLDSILTVVGSHYGKVVSFRDDSSRTMKLITKWNPADSLTEFIAHLNMFDYLRLTLEGDTIFVQSINDEEER